MRHFVFRPVDADDELMIGGKIVRQGVGLAVRHKKPVIDNDDPLAHRMNFRQDMGAQDDRVVAPKRFDQVADFDNLLWVKAYGRLVQDQDGSCLLYTSRCV